MRVAVIFVAMIAMATPSHASSSCMDKTEARRHFGSVHIYWHGANHCWDATPTRRGLASRGERPRAQRPQREEQPAKWRDARSEMIADSEPTPPIKDAIEPTEAPPSKPHWSDRWVDVAQIAPISLVNTSLAKTSLAKTSPVSALPNGTHGTEVTVAPYGAALLLLGSTMVLVFVGFLFRSGNTPIGIFAAVQRRIYY
jgi:hypothetical protein